MTTLIRLPADPFRADVLRGETSPLLGEVVCAARQPKFDPDAPLNAKSLNRREKRWRTQRSCQTLLGRLMSQVTKTDTHWFWTGATNGSYCYGTISISNRSRYVHRVMYEMVRGPIPVGLEIDHLCRTPLCVNPDHLEAVTRRVNQRRGYHYNAVKTHCPQGHRYDRDNTQWSTRGNGDSFRMCRSCKKARELTKRAPACRYCGGSGTWIGGDEAHECWCVRERRDEEEGE